MAPLYSSGKRTLISTEIILHFFFICSNENAYSYFALYQGIWQILSPQDPIFNELSGLAIFRHLFLEILHELLYLPTELLS